MNEWWQNNLRRQRAVRPRQLPPLSPSMHGSVQPMVDEPVAPPIETLGGLTSQAPPIAPPAEVSQGFGTGLPMPAQPEAIPEQAPPKMDQQELDYAQIMAPPKKANKLLDALYVAAQGAANIFDTEGNYQPIERLGDTKKRYKDAQAMQRIQVRNAKQKAEQESSKRGWEIKKEEAEVGKKTLEALQQKNPVLWEAIKQKGFIDANDQAAIQQAGYGYVPQGSWFQTETIYDKDGNLLWTPKTGAPNYQSTGIQDPKQGTSIYKGRPMKPSEAGRLESDDAQFNTREVNDVTVKNAELFRQTINDNYERQRQYERDVNDVLSKQVSLLQSLGNATPQDTALEKQFGDLQWALQDINDKYTKSTTAEEAETFKRQYETIYGQVEALQQKMANRIRQQARGDAQIGQVLSQLQLPKRPKLTKFEPITAQTTDAQSIGTYDRSTFIDRAKARGLIGDALKAAIADAERKGIIK